jgi:hypothetical protein
MRTATIHRRVLFENSSMRFEASFSSDSTTVTGSPQMPSRISAYARATVWSVAITRPPASGMPCRTSVSRRSAACSTAGIHSPVGSSAVRHAEEVMSFVLSSPSFASISSPALVRHRMWPA